MRVRFTRSALRDLAEIQAYIAQDSATSASHIVARLIERSRQLVDNPLEGRKTDESNVRVIVVTRLRYLIFYSVDMDEIQITHIRHTSRLRPDGWGR